MLTKPQLAQILRFIADTLETTDPSWPTIAAAALAASPTGKPAAPAKPRGRPRKDNAAPAEQAPAGSTSALPPPEPGSTATPDPGVEANSVEKPATTAPEPVPAVTGLTYEQLQKLISPLIQASRGPEVKAVLDTFAPDDFEVTESNHYLLSLLAKRPQTHADFVKKIEALLI